MNRATPVGTRSPARRARFLLSGVLVLAVLAGGGFFLAGILSSPGAAPGRTAASLRSTVTSCGTGDAGSCAVSPDTVAIAASPALVTVPPRYTATAASPSASARSSSPRPAASETASAQPGPSSSPPAQDGTAADQVLALINQARSQAGLPALTITSGLETSSAAHNLLMADGCGLSHQCPGEPSLGARETAAGVDWTSAGENIGEGGPVADTEAAIAQMAVGLTQSMLNEQPPNDGHRLNILSSTFTHIGIAVYRDSSGTVWLTQDFSN
jgi:uncharacterized protein YkwD